MGYTKVALCSSDNIQLQQWSGIIIKVALSTQAKHVGSETLWISCCEKQIESMDNMYCIL